MNLIFIFLFLPCLAFAKVSNIVVIHSYPEGEWQNGIKKGFEENLSKFGKTFSFHHFLYDYEQLKFKSLALQQERVKQILSDITKLSPEYILVNDDEAIEKFIHVLKPFKNVVLNGLNIEPNKSIWGHNQKNTDSCGIIEHYPITQSLKMISMMSKDIKSMTVLTSKGDSSRIVADIFKGLSNEQLHHIKLRKIYLEDKWSSWKARLKEMNQTDQLGWILVPYEVVDDSGKMVPINEMAAWIKKNVSIPLLGILSIHTKLGFLSAISVDPYGLGKQASEMVMRLEKGESCQKIGLENSKYHNFEINVSEVKRLGLTVPESFIGVAKFINSNPGNVTR